MIGSSALEANTYRQRNDLYFLFSGRIVLEECERLRGEYLPLINMGVEQVIIDLSKVDFIDSAGLGVLVGMKMTASKNKARIVLLQPSKTVADILYISKLDGIFDIVTGADAELLKSQNAQPQFLVKGGDKQTIPTPSQTGEWKTSKFERTFPEVSMEMVAAQGESVPDDEQRGDTLRSQRELVEEMCRHAVEYMRQGNYDLSVEEYRRALEMDPEYLPALNNLAIVYEKQPSWMTKAIEQWEKVLQLSQQRADQKHIDRAQRHLANLRKMTG